MGWICPECGEALPTGETCPCSCGGDGWALWDDDEDGDDDDGQDDD